MLRACWNDHDVASAKAELAVVLEEALGVLAASMHTAAAMDWIGTGPATVIRQSGGPAPNYCDPYYYPYGCYGYS